MIGFKQIPTALRVPLFYAELDASHANTAAFSQRALIIGQITATGGAPANIPLISAGEADAKVQGGVGSMLALMTAAYRAADPFGEVWYLPLADDGAGVAATGSIAFAGTPTAVGVISLYIGGQKVSLAVTVAQAAAAIATALAAAINAKTDLPVTAAVDGTLTSKVNITAKNKGLGGNDIDLRVNYLGTAGGEATPAGVTPTIVAMASGATNPVLTTALANLQDLPFDVIVLPYTDATSLAALKAFLSDATGRWSWQTQVYGHVVYAYRGTYSGLTTFGATQNDQHASAMAIYDSPTPNWIWAAALAGAALSSLRSDPALPLQTVAIPGVLAPPIASRFNLSQRNALLFDGLSTYTVDPDGTVRIENLLTTYQLNASGQPDDSYLQIETLFTLMAVLRRLKSTITSQFGRMKLAADGTRFAPGSNIVTPAIVRASLIAAYREMEFEGLVQKSREFAQGLVVQQNASNPSRLDVMWPGTLIDGLRIFALLAQFRLS